MNFEKTLFQTSDMTSGFLVTPRASGQHRLAKLISDENGAAFILAAVLLPVLLIACALSIDIGFSLSEISSMQQAADNAVRSAAIIKFLNGSTDADVQNEGSALAAAHGYVSGVDFVTVTVNPNYKVNASTTGVEVVISKKRKNLLAGIVGNFVNIGARAVSAYTSAPCMIALRNNSTGQTGIAFNGTDDATFGCALYSNSTSTTKSIAVNGGAKITTPYAGMAGCTNSSIGNMQCNVSQVPNPYASVVAQVPSTVPSGTTQLPSGNNNFSCANSVGCTVNGSDVTGGSRFGPGNYFVTGSASISGNSSSFTATGATIWFQNGFSVTGNSGTISITNSVFLFPSTSTTSKAGFSVSGNSTKVTMTPPTSGPYAGFTVVDASTPSPSVDTGFTGKSTDLTLSGIFVTPNNDLKFGGSTDLSKGTCFNMVAATITFAGSTDINNTCLSKNANLSGYAGAQLIE